MASLDGLGADLLKLQDLLHKGHLTQVLFESGRPRLIYKYDLGAVPAAIFPPGLRPRATLHCSK